MKGGATGILNKLVLGGEGGRGGGKEGLNWCCRPPRVCETLRARGKRHTTVHPELRDPALRGAARNVAEWGGQRQRAAGRGQGRPGSSGPGRLGVERRRDIASPGLGDGKLLSCVSEMN